MNIYNKYKNVLFIFDYETFFIHSNIKKISLCFGDIFNRGVLETGRIFFSKLWNIIAGS
jgi:hypothetical protein